MKIQFSSIGTTLIVSLSGELDHHWAEYLKNKVDVEIMKPKTRDVIFDFADVSFMDSSGIGVLIGRYKNIKKLSGRMLATHVKGQIRKIYAMSGLEKIIPVYDTLDLALMKLKGVAI